MGSETLQLDFPELSPDAFAYSKRKLEVQGEVPCPMLADGRRDRPEANVPKSSQTGSASRVQMGVSEN